MKRSTNFVYAVEIQVRMLHRLLTRHRKIRKQIQPQAEDYPLSHYVVRPRKVTETPDRRRADLDVALEHLSAYAVNIKLRQQIHAMGNGLSQSAAAGNVL